MATKKFIIEVEEGETCCDNCPMECQGYCPSTTMGVLGRCDELNLATMKIMECNEPIKNRIEPIRKYSAEDTVGIIIFIGVMILIFIMSIVLIICL